MLHAAHGALTPSIFTFENSKCLFSYPHTHFSFSFLSFCRAGIVYNVTKRAVGVEVNKQVRNRIEKKRFNLRVEHVHVSKCRQDFLDRVQKNDKLKREAKEAKKTLPIEMLKRYFGTPKAGYVASAQSSAGLPVLLRPLPFDDVLN